MTDESSAHGVAVLRGADAPSFGRPFWSVVGTLLFVMVTLVVVVSFVSAVNDNARIERLKTHGLSVVVTVTGCVGNIGGSGSNAAGYTCHGTYRVHGVRYREVIGSKTTLSSVGSELKGVADPDRPSTVEVASAVTSSSAKVSVYIVPSLLALVLVASAMLLLRRQRFSRSGAGSSR